MNKAIAASTLSFGKASQLRSGFWPHASWLNWPIRSKAETPVNSDFSDLLQSLNDAGADYLVVGGLAVIVHTEPRYTKDLDIWIDNSRPNAEKVFRALGKFGAPLDEVTVEDFTLPGLVYQIGVEPTRIDILMSLDEMEFADCWPRRVPEIFDGVSMNLISIADLVENKERTGRPQDLIDAANLRKKLANY